MVAAVAHECTSCAPLAVQAQRIDKVERRLTRIEVSVWVCGLLPVVLKLLGLGGF